MRPDKYNFFCQVVSDSMLAELKQCFLEAYDDNRDGKIDIREVWKRQNAIFLCEDTFAPVAKKKTLSAFGYSSYYIYTSKGGKKSTVALLLLLL